MTAGDYGSGPFKKVKGVYSSSREPISELQSVTCHGMTLLPARLLKISK